MNQYRLSLLLLCLQWQFFYFWAYFGTKY